MTAAEEPAAYARCLEQARRIVSTYRARAPHGCDPQNTFAWTAAAVVVSVIGAGVSAYGQYQAGKQADMIARYNAHQQEFNARTQLMTMQAESNLRRQTADANFRLRQAEAQARFSNAQNLANQAEATSRNARESIRRKAEEQGRFTGAQRARIAASNLVESSGTPLDILAETAGKIQLEREDALHTDEVSRRTLFREADLERLGGQLAIAGATLDRSSELAATAINAASGQAAYRSRLRDAELTRLSGRAQRTAATYQAAGTLISGIGSALGGVK